MPIYMQLDGVPGESKDAAHEGWIDILSLGAGVTNSGTFAMGGGGGRGSSLMQDLSVVVNEGLSSPKLFQACCDGTHFKSCEIHFTKSGGAQEIYMIWKMEKLLVSSYSISGSNQENPVDQVTFNFETIEYEYKPQDEEGNLGEKVVATWDQGKNTPK